MGVSQVQRPEKILRTIYCSTGSSCCTAIVQSIMVGNLKITTCCSFSGYFIKIWILQSNASIRSINIIVVSGIAGNIIRTLSVSISSFQAQISHLKNTALCTLECVLDDSGHKASSGSWLRFFSHVLGSLLLMFFDFCRTLLSSSRWALSTRCTFSEFVAINEKCAFSARFKSQT